MIVAAQKLRAFHADGAIAKRRTLGGASNNTNMAGHAGNQQLERGSRGEV